MITFIELTDKGKCLKAVNDETITEFIVPNGVEHMCIHAFHKCNSLKKLVIPRTLKSIDHSAFAHYTSLEKIEIEEENCLIKQGFDLFLKYFRNLWD